MQSVYAKAPADWTRLTRGYTTSILEVKVDFQAVANFILSALVKFLPSQGNRPSATALAVQTTRGSWCRNTLYRVRFSNHVVHLARSTLVASALVCSATKTFLEPSGYCTLHTGNFARVVSSSKTVYSEGMLQATIANSDSCAQGLSGFLALSQPCRVWDALAKIGSFVSIKRLRSQKFCNILEIYQTVLHFNNLSFAITY